VFLEDLKRGKSNCYNSLSEAQTAQAKAASDECCAEIFAFAWDESDANRKKRETDPGTGRIRWNDATAYRNYETDDGILSGLFDFGYYDPTLKAFWHAEVAEHYGGNILVSLPGKFGTGYKSVIYCVVCKSDELYKSVRS
jgi:hypothetical protein